MREIRFRAKDPEWSWLSNFWPCEIKSRSIANDEGQNKVIDWFTFPSVENAYQASKTTEWSFIKELMDPKTKPWLAKKIGRQVKLIPGWEQKKDAVMEFWVRKKFQIPELQDKLLATGDALLVEETYWHDTYWGICICPKHGGEGQNKLGKILMKVRDEKLSKAKTSLEVGKEAAVKTTVINIKDAPPGWETNPQYVYIGRAGKGFDGKWGNRHPVGGVCSACSVSGAFVVSHERGTAVEAFRNDFNLAVLFPEGQWGWKSVERLRGKILVCFCKPEACHGDPIAQYLNAKKDEPSITIVEPKPEKPKRKIYTGIGSRETPPEIILLMMNIGNQMAKVGWTLRSGNATGADQAFEAGHFTSKVPNKSEIYLPWKSFERTWLDNMTKGEENMTVMVSDGPSRAALEMAWQMFPERMSRARASVTLLIGRNMHQVLGPNLDAPSDLVVFWAPVDPSGVGGVGGGTGYAAALAKKHGIKTYNLFDPKVEEHFRNAIAKKGG